jgi:tetratricopeptide (TPR) repeat protein
VCLSPSIHWHADWLISIAETIPFDENPNARVITPKVAPWNGGKGIPEGSRLTDEMVLLREEGDKAYETGDWHIAIMKYKAMTALGLSLNNKEALAEGYRKTAHVERLRGEYRRAMRLYEQALAISKVIGDRAGIADNLRGISYIHSRRAEYEQALENGERALEQARNIGDPSLMGKVLIDIGNVHNAVGRYDEALEHYHKALDILPKREFFERGRVNNNIGELYKRQGKYERALENLERVISEGTKTGDANNKAWALFCAAECHARLKDLTKAEEYLTQSEEMLRRSADDVGLQELLKVWGLILRIRGDIDKARQRFEESIMLGKKLDLPPETASSYVEFGKMLLELGDTATARNCYRQAMALYEASGLKRERQEVEGLLKGLPDG